MYGTLSPLYDTPKENHTAYAYTWVWSPISPGPGSGWHKITADPKATYRRRGVGLQGSRIFTNVNHQPQYGRTRTVPAQRSYPEKRELPLTLPCNYN